MTTGFRSLHPLPCFVYYIGVMLLSMLLLHPVFLVAEVILLFIINLAYEGTGKMLRTLVVFLLVGLIIFVMNPLFSHRGAHILFYIGDQQVTLEAMLYGLTAALSPIAIIFTFLSYNRVVTSDKFLYLFGSLWPKGSLIVVMGMRFVPLLTRRLKQISLVQRTKGVSLTQGSLKERCQNGMKLLQILLTWSLEEGLQTADSMKARGYGTGPRSAYSPFRMQGKDRLALVYMVLLGAYCLWGRFMAGYGVLTIYPRLEDLELNPGEWFVFGVFLLFISTPLLLDGKEWLRWRFSK
jgi:energy-coupling factor transport system permease protein